MKRNRPSAADVKRGEAVRVRDAESLLARKAAAKVASASSREKKDAALGRSPFSFVPHDAQLKVNRWPKL